MSSEENFTFSAQSPVEPPPSIPEQIEINGVVYRRASGFVDREVNHIREYQAIAARTGISLRQAIWFAYRGDSNTVMPDEYTSTISGKQLDDAVAKALKRLAT